MQRCAARLSPRILLGTSSWSFPGWAGLVYHDAYSEAELARSGLPAYAAHPLLRMVGIDRTYYAPISRTQFEAYAAQTPPGFRFLCKCFDGVTAPFRTQRGGSPASRRQPSPHFLDANFAANEVIAPFVLGLGPRAGPLVFQFSPMSPRTLGEPRAFIDKLAAFLTILPRGPLYAVELRNAELLIEAYAQALRNAGAVHCYNVHPRMPRPGAQAAILPPLGPLVVRWMLHARWDYDAARAAYAPFDQIVDDDAVNRAEIAELCGHAALRGDLAFVAVNNKAEGCAPRSVFRLAQAISP